MSLVMRIKDRELFAAELKSRLAEEFKTPTPGYIEPLISIERQNHGYDHILVVWRDWEEMTTRERSEIIIEAYEEAFSLDVALNVTFALGLTETEAKRKGFIFQPVALEAVAA